MPLSLVIMDRPPFILRGPELRSSAMAANLLLVGFLAAEVDGHQDFDGNAAAAIAEVVDAHYSAERLPVERARPVGIRVGDKHAHAFRVRLVLRSKIDALARSVQRRQDFVEVMPV